VLTGLRGTGRPQAPAIDDESWTEATSSST
jgi:hypothetical protein